MRKQRPSPEVTENSTKIS
jgi:hypothetical protein